MDELLIRFVKQQVRNALVGLYELYGYELSSVLSDELSASELEKLFIMLEEPRCNTTSGAGALPGSQNCVTNQK